MIDSVGQLIFFLLTPLSHIGASLFFAKPRFGKAATAAIWLLYVELMMILPPDTPTLNFFSAMDKAMQSISVRKNESIVLKVGGEYRNISIDHILYCEADNNYQRLWLKDGSQLPVRMTASELYDMLSGFDRFHRCGRAYILNLDHIRKVSPNCAVLKNGIQLPVPRTAAAPLRDAFFDHFQ